MIKNAILCAAVIAAPLLSPFSFSESQFNWPNGARAAISLSYDDALSSQLDNAIPALNQHGMKASFYVHIDSPGFKSRLDDWQAAAKSGHELGNHSLFHQCAKVPDRTWLKNHHDLNKISAEQMRDEILLANKVLFALDGKQERTLTVPCGDFIAGGDNYIDLVQSHFLGIKSNLGNELNSMENFDRNYVESVAGDQLDGKGLIKFVQRAAEKGAVASIVFHGVGGDYLQTSKESHQQLVEYLAANKDKYWVDTFANIMKHVNTQQESTNLQLGLN